jgi:tRNA threonylcarbamoyladenosine biosynthesis protein TsaE
MNPDLNTDPDANTAPDTGPGASPGPRSAPDRPPTPGRPPVAGRPLVPAVPPAPGGPTVPDRPAIPDLPPDSVVPTAAAMRALGSRLAGLLRSGDLVLLAGPLGAGKTTLVQGLGEALRVRGHVTSPTFVIARVHPSLSGGPSLVHVDAYRLGSLAEMDDLDLDLDGAVTVVEWGEGLAEGLSADRLEVTIGFAGRRPGGENGENGENSNAAPGEGDEPRRVQIRRIGPRWTASRDEPAGPGEPATARTQSARRA